MTSTATAPAPPARRPPPRGGPGRRWAGWGFLAPFMTVFALVFVAPIAYSLYLSVYRNRLVGGTSFVGADNYRTAFTDPVFWDAVVRVGLFLAVQVPIMLFLALLLALALDSGRLYGRDFFRISIFLPYAVPAVVATLMWGFMYGTRFGLVGNANDLLGITLPDPLSPGLVLASIGNIVTWQFVGYNMLILYSALRTVPHELYEAAEVDGAGQLRVITAVKLPALRGALVIAAVFSVIGSFQLFNEPSILRNLAPNAITSGYTPNLYTYSLAFSGQQQNQAAAVAVIMGLLTMAVAYAVQLFGMRRAV
ncbi:multiple sugar transport system permease protein [Nocardiopsis flavescens]|uniref:Multiple sugar transport system permease protein n=1 Tax=Nocardiopsis flavescens TaxID=758803 RepID=A0A1M6C5T3_9ACTN|nr:sugar ABC transporter permease [Nocardiopsis flavescens]SHI56407.1 multiple sugar transport system permease protein [Nocardiopsis flavescens]